MSTLQEDIKRLRGLAEVAAPLSSIALRNVCDALEASLKEIARLEERPNIPRERLRQIRAKMRRRWEENRSLAAQLEKCSEALRFYRDENNWLTKPGHPCSAIIADTGTRARKALGDKD